MKWLKGQGGLEAMAKLNHKKAELIYNVIDASNGFYTYVPLSLSLFPFTSPSPPLPFTPSVSLLLSLFPTSPPLSPSSYLPPSPFPSPPLTHSQSIQMPNLKDLKVADQHPHQDPRRRRRRRRRERRRRRRRRRERGSGGDLPLGG